VQVSLEKVPDKYGAWALGNAYVSREDNDKKNAAVCSILLLRIRV
jgi:hypothetical protein